MQAWHGRKYNENGKQPIVFNTKYADQANEPFDISCGQCIGCRLERSRQWATRCLHEAQLHEENCFITLTFSDEGLALREKQYIEKNKKIMQSNNTQKKKNKIVQKFQKLHDVPPKESIKVQDFQLFMKRLRKHYGPKIRFFACGEYGDENGRPHYHAILFNFNFPDKIKYQETNADHILFTSATLEKLWPYGFATIGQVTFDSCAYVARYVMKKINGKRQEKHYQHFDRETWELINIKPEFCTMSRAKGIGFKWFEKYNKEVYDNDSVVVNGKLIPAPKYYDNQLKIKDPYHYDQIKEKRVDNRKINSIDNTPERLAIREKVTELRLTQNKREV